VPEPLQLSYTGILALTFPHTSTFTPNSVLGNILIEAPNGAITAKTQGVLQSALTGITPDSAIITLLSGYELLNNSGGLLLAGELSAFQTFQNVTPPSPVTGPYLSAKVLDGSGSQVGRLEWTSANQNIDVSGSGVLGASILLDATGSLIGNIVALNNANLQAVHDIGVTAVAGGRVNASSASGNITGNIIASGGVSVSGLDVSANLVSSSVSGATSGQSGLGSGNTAGGSSTAAGADQSSKTATTTGLNSTDETSPDKKKGKSVALAQKISRVTVLLPGKNN